MNYFSTKKVQIDSIKFIDIARPSYEIKVYYQTSVPASMIPQIGDIMKFSEYKDHSSTKYEKFMVVSREYDVTDFMDKDNPFSSFTIKIYIKKLD